MIITTRYVYDVVKLQSRKSFTCKVCGKRGQRSKTFRQTINPFNKNAAGELKTAGEIWQELQHGAATWAPDTHAGCESS